MWPLKYSLENHKPLPQPNSWGLSFGNVVQDPPNYGARLPEPGGGKEGSEAVLDAFRKMQESSKSRSVRSCTGIFPCGI